MLHVMGFIYFAAMLGTALAIIAVTLLTDRDRIADALGLRSDVVFSPLPRKAARQVVTLRVIRTVSTESALRLAA
jgi:hypothetical protein